MNNKMKSLYSTLFMSMLETNRANCVSMYEKLSMPIEDKITILEGTASVIINGSTMTKEMSDNVHLLYDTLISTYPNFRVPIVESYNRVKDLLNKNKLDGKYMLLFENIIQREFGVCNPKLFDLYSDAADKYYISNFDKLMDDIAFDYYVIDYLLHPFDFIDNDICKDERFVKSLKYIVNVNHKFLDYETYINIKSILTYRETLMSNKLVEKIKTKRKHKKIMRIMEDKYETRA